MRNAYDESPGRLFYMAEMGMEIVSKHNASVSFFGSSLNTDHLWLKCKYLEVQTKLVNLENMQQAENFEANSEATPSDVVIASEVIEHFTEPVATLRVAAATAQGRRYPYLQLQDLRR